MPSAGAKHTPDPELVGDLLVMDGISDHHEPDFPASRSGPFRFKERPDRTGFPRTVEIVRAADFPETPRKAETQDGSVQKILPEC